MGGIELASSGKINPVSTIQNAVKMRRLTVEIRMFY